ncbi:MAG: hypothetical protein ABIR87_05130 [Sphingomicrobium sp.]
MGNSKKLDIYVEPDKDSPNGYKFSMEEKGVKTHKVVFNKNDDNMRKSQSYDVQFKVHNKMGADVAFSADPNIVMWVKKVANETDPCPDTACFLPGEFFVSSFDHNDSSVYITNTDMKVETLAFAFNFFKKGEIEGPKTKYIRFDPIGSNQNSGLTDRKSSALIIALGVGVAAIIALVAISAFTSMPQR